MADLVAEILARDAEDSNHLKTINVEKELELEYDLGHLLATDPNTHDLKKFNENKDEYLKSLTRDNVQLLINQLWKLPVERREEVIVALLPASKTRLPREKPIPKERPPTKWEEYSQKKGIQNRKKSKLVWDEKLKEWKPRWGYNRVDDEKKDWVLEVPQNADPFEDQFAKRKKAKQERVAKNEFQRLRNIARAKKIPVAGVGVGPTDNPSRDQMAKARNLARVATASVGKFTQVLPKEKVDKRLGKKRKFEPLIGDSKLEKEKTLDIVSRIQKKKPRLDIEKAVSNKKFQPSVEDDKQKFPKRSAKRRNKDKRGRQTGKRKPMGKKKGKGRGK
uniref:Ribosome biogenesis regulatory protein n=1 Tax=Strigamia maritima TaxID=126957 RepID=T1IH02_STRMM